MKKALILGSQGMAGHIISIFLKNTKQYEVYNLARNNDKNVDYCFDVTKEEKLNELFHNNRFDYVINCIGVLVKASKNNIENAIKINSLLPHILDKYSKEYGFMLIHISTDCVFSGKAGNYRVNDVPDGYDSYSKTKALGEINNERSLTIRTSIIGPELKNNGTGLLDWIFKSSGLVMGYSKAYWNGVTTLELAKIIHYSMQKKITGLVQFSVEEKISKYDLLKIVKEKFSLVVEIQNSENYEIDKSLIPSYDINDYGTISYVKMIDDLVLWMNDYKHLYRHYSNIPI